MMILWMKTAIIIMVILMTIFRPEAGGVFHRLNDNEDKWIVSLSGETIQTEDILETISFQEQYFMGELYTL